jgi:hypothetical protein
LGIFLNEKARANKVKVITKLAADFDTEKISSMLYLVSNAYLGYLLADSLIA